MRYKVQTLYLDNKGIVDIPKGWIPIKYEETLEISSGSGTGGGRSFMHKKIIALEPIGEDEYGNYLDR